MKEAHDHWRVCEVGKKAGEIMASAADIGFAILEAAGEPVECCKSCAFRRGTVPNGCAQTQTDVMKAVLEGKSFMCHVNTIEGGMRDICQGWFAARQHPNIKDKSILCNWEFSPPDDAAHAQPSNQSNESE